MHFHRRVGAFNPVSDLHFTFIAGGAGALYALMTLCAQLGAIAGALGTAQRGHAQGRGRLMLVAYALFGAFTIGATQSRWQWLSMLLLVGSGFFLTTAFSTLNSLVQEMAPEALRGRVLSIFGLAFRGGGPFGSLAAGAVVRHAGAPAVVALYSVLLVVIALTLLARPTTLREL